VLNNQIDAVLTALFMIFVALIIIDALRVWYKVVIKHEKLPLKESPYVAREASAVGG
jgi:carbon starvation protein